MYQNVDDIAAYGSYGWDPYQDSSQPTTTPGVGAPSAAPGEEHAPTIAWGALVLAAVALAVLERIAKPEGA